MGVDTSLQYNGYNSYKFNQNDFLICYPFGVENMEYITHSFGAYSPIALSAKVRAYTRFFNADGEEIKLENHSFAVQQGTFDKVEITVSVPASAVKAELKFLNNEAQPWWVATPKTEEGQTATPYAINAYGQLTYITPNGIYTGTITANQIVLASGGTLPERLTKINANGVYTGEIVADQINGGTIIGVTIIADNGTIAGFKLGGLGFSKTSSKTFGPFTSADVTTLQQIILSGATPTQSQLNKYDLNRDGILDLRDMVAVSGIVNGTDSPTRNYTVNINSDNPDEAIKVSAKDSVSGQNMGETVIGTNIVKTPTVKANTIITDGINIGTGATGSFRTADGKDVYFENGIIYQIS